MKGKIMEKTIKKETPATEISNTEIVAQTEEKVNEILDINLWIETRKEFKEKVGSIMLEGSDYHIIKDKKSLAKGGAEKIASIFGWVATFEKDTDALEMLGGQKGLVAFTCVLTKNDKVVGQGRGASMLQGDPNKTLKMAQKSAFIDAVLRASGLSDIYTQDLEDMNFEKPIAGMESKARMANLMNKIDDRVAKEQSTIPASVAQLKLIKDLMKQKEVTKEEIIDAGFVGDSLKLTGGKTGTASELIGWLFDYKKPVVEDLPVITQEVLDEAFPS